MTDTANAIETSDPITDYYTMLLLADIQQASSTIKLSSVEGVYKGRVLYTSDMDDFFTILSVNYDTNTEAAHYLERSWTTLFFPYPEDDSYAF